MPTTPEVTETTDASTLGAAIAKGIADGMASIAPPRKVTSGSYNPQGPFQPKNKKLVAKLKRAAFQNGAKINPRFLFNAEIDLFNRITRSGRYINRLMEVIVRPDGGDEVVELRYNNKSFDQRYSLKGDAKDMTAILTAIVEEQDAIIAAEEARYATPPPASAPPAAFSTKATREARERAAAREAAAD